MQISYFLENIAPFLSGLLGVAISYGALKTEIKNLKEDVQRNETKIDNQVSSDICKQFRDDCHRNLCVDLKEIKEEIVRLRDVKNI